MKIDVRGLAAVCGSLVLSACCSCCRPLSERVSEPEAGLNGGFEVVREGLPVQWQVYSPATVPGAAFVIAYDEAERREGRQALRFDVAACGDGGGWRSPGLAREIEVEPGGTYDVSFWVKSEGCRWSAVWGAVDAKTGALEPNEASPTEQGDWRRVEARYTVPEAYRRLRLQFNVLSAGRLWLDGVRVERADA